MPQILGLVLHCRISALPMFFHGASINLTCYTTLKYWRKSHCIKGDLLSRARSREWCYTMVLYYLGPADTVDRWWLSTNKHYVPPCLNMFFFFHLYPNLKVLLAHWQHHITALVLFLWLWMPTPNSTREWWQIPWDSSTLLGSRWRSSPSSLWMAHMKPWVIRIWIIERVVKCLLESDWSEESDSQR